MVGLIISRRAQTAQGNMRTGVKSWMSQAFMRITFDSNVWQMVVMPSLVPTHKDHDDFVTFHEALRTKHIEGFISETVGTLEAIKLAGRTSYFTSIKPIVDVKTEVKTGNQIVLSVKIGTNHSQHPGLPPVLQDRLEAALSLGFRLLRTPRIGVPVPALFLNLENYAEEDDIVASAERDNRWGEVLEAIELRGVGGAVLRDLKKVPSQLTSERPFKQSLKTGVAEHTKFPRAVAEWADGDSIAAHVAYNNDVFCSEDQGKSAGVKSILDKDNRLWLQKAYGARFATIHELAQQIK
jgi:hypothetical protein